MGHAAMSQVMRNRGRGSDSRGTRTLRSLPRHFPRLATMTGRMKLDLGTFLIQWAAGGLLFGWVTTRGRLVSLGYGWLLRAVYGIMAVVAAVVWLRDSRDTQHLLSIIGALATAVAALYGIGLSAVRRRAGVSGRKALNRARRERVAEMSGAPRTPGEEAPESEPETDRREFPPIIDAIAAGIGFLTILIAAPISGGTYWVAALRLIIGAAMLGAVSDAMLLGHWYLTQPGLPRDPLKELVRWTAVVTPFAILSWLIPTGIPAVFTGEINDGFSGLLGWVWAVSGATTMLLLGATWLALRERFYSAVMAATGLLYLAILTTFGIDLVARAVISP